MNSDLDEYDIDRDKHADKRDSGKDKCVCFIHIFLATQMSGDTNEDIEISFGDSYDAYHDDSVNVTVTEHSSRDKVNADDSLSKFKEIIEQA